MEIFGIRPGSWMKDYGLPKKLLKTGLNLWQDIIVAFGRMAGLIDFPVPPNSNIRKTGGKGVTSYFVGGIRTSLPLMAVMRREGVRLDQKIRVLDFGCGVARPLLHFTRDHPAPSYYACDIDDSAVAFVRKAYPQVQATVSKFTPPLPYESAFFDLVYSVSIFSHLNMDDQVLWLKELARVTRPGGMCFLSTVGSYVLNIRSRQMGLDQAAAAAQLASQGYLYKEYADWRENVQNQRTLSNTSLLVGVERSYGTTLVTPDYIRKNWPAAGWEVCTVVEGVIDGHDVAVLRRL